MGELVAKNLVLEFTSAGVADGRAYMEGFAFKTTNSPAFLTPTTAIWTPQNIRDKGVFVASKTSVLVGVPGVVSFGGRAVDIPFFGLGPDAGLVLTVTYIPPGGSAGAITDTWTRVR